VRRILLDNGMVGLIKRDASAPVAAVQIWVGTGSVHEEDHLGAGLSHYMEHMIFKGTPTRGPAEITKAIDEAGGEINAYTAHDRTVFHADLPSKSWKVGVDVLGDAVMNAHFPEEEWEREKEVILREFAMGYDSPEREMSKLLWSTAYRVHPYRLPVIGYEEIFRTITREDLLAFFRRHYVPDNMIIAVVGDVDEHEVETYLRELFKPFTRRTRAPVQVPAEPPQVAPREGRKSGPYEVTRGTMAWHTVDLSHPDAPALDVLASRWWAMAGAPAWRWSCKERRQLVHSMDAWSFTPREPGLFGVSFSCEPEKETEVLQALNEQVTSSWLGGPSRGGNGQGAPSDPGGRVVVSANRLRPGRQLCLGRILCRQPALFRNLSGTPAGHHPRPSARGGRALPHPGKPQPGHAGPGGQNAGRPADAGGDGPPEPATPGAFQRSPAHRARGPAAAVCLYHGRFHGRAAGGKRHQ
jgi:predicted Zn-dependent peptidase